jgi:hypothetical protein
VIPASLAAHLLEMGLMKPQEAPAPLYDLSASRYSAKTGVVTAWKPEYPDQQPPF